MPFDIRASALGGLLLAGALLFPCASPASGFFSGKHYPIVTDAIFTADEFILDQARFWYAIYVEVDVDEGLIHDPFFPDLVFRKAPAPGQGRVGSKAAEFQVLAMREEIRSMLAKDPSAWNDEDRALKARFPAFWDSSAILLSVERLRFQRGLKSKFRAGLERSYRYLPMIDSVFLPLGVPERLKYLPHVESSFYPYAYSKVGAAGMWQFMKSSAKRFKMNVGYLVDERRDPHASTAAAGEMLAYNFRYLKSWPLAIVAYNHGPGGLARAVRGTGTTDLGTIIKTHYSPSFGFASKNFYAEFLAASSIAMKADSIYPDLRKLEPLRFQVLALPKPYTAKYLCAVMGMSPDELEEYNLGLRPTTFRGKAPLPKGFVLRLPPTLDLAAVTARLGGPAMAASVAVAMATTPKEAVPQDKVVNVDQDADPTAPVKPEKTGRVRKSKKPAGEPKPQPVILAADSPPPAAPPTLPTGKDKPASAVIPAAVPPIAAAVALERPPEPEERVVDPNLALQASDLDKLAHPMDRFNPALYHLGYEYANGALTFEVGTEETLSHYAEWAWVPEKTLRRLNRIRNSRDFRMGRRIRIPLTEEKAKEFVKRREEYYRAIEEDFYSNYYVSVSEPLTVVKGLNLWNWALEREVPFWLLQKHNPGKALNALRPGDTLNLPVIETGIRKWGFTRYGSSQEYLAGISRYLSSGKPEAY